MGDGVDQFIRYKTSSPAGDLISFLAGIRQMWKETDKKAIIFQQINVVGVGIQGVSQPFTDSNGNSILLGEEMFNNLKPLIEAQEYVESYLEYKGEKVDLDFDDLRNKIFTNQPLGSLNRYPFYAFPQMNVDLSEAWLGKMMQEEEEMFRDKIIINFTFRYRNNFINYFFLKKYQELIYFIGLKDEYIFFCKQWDLEVNKIKLLNTKNFYGYAAAIENCKFFMGNASCMFQIAEALKVPRILEIFQLLPNVIPVGKDAYDAYHQSAIEFYFDRLINK